MFSIYQIKVSILDLSRSKLKSSLSILGILIGVFAVIVLMAFGSGLDVYVKNQFDSLGANTLFITPGNVLGSRSGPASIGSSINFDIKDVNNLSKVEFVRRAVPVSTRTTTAQALGNSILSEVYATNDQLFELRNLKIQSGNLFSNRDLQAQRKVAVIGPNVADELFGSSLGSIGKSIELNKQKFMVIGVLEKQGGVSLGGPDFDSYVYIPYSAGAGLVESGKFSLIYLQAFDKDQVVPLQKLATDVLLRRYKTDDFSVIEQGQILAIANSIFSVINGVLLVIGSVSLLVGGIGIMNIMYATVTERTKEIGIRRALGANQKDIRNMFLVESTVLTFMGGLMGLLFSIVVVVFGQRFFPLAMTPLSIIVGLGVSCAIGMFFGVFPAQRAAKLSPIEAIRYE